MWWVARGSCRSARSGIGLVKARSLKDDPNIVIDLANFTLALRADRDSLIREGLDYFELVPAGCAGIFIGRHTSESKVVRELLLIEDEIGELL